MDSRKIQRRDKGRLGYKVMTSAELISALRACGPQTLSVSLHFIADRIPELALADGQRLNDGTDMIVCLRELARCAEVRDLPRRPHDAMCPDCDHEHEGRTECSKYLGEGKFCHCESKVTA